MEEETTVWRDSYSVTRNMRCMAPAFMGLIGYWGLLEETDKSRGNCNTMGWSGAKMGKSRVLREGIREGFLKEATSKLAGEG